MQAAKWVLGSLVVILAAMTFRITHSSSAQEVLPIPDGTPTTELRGSMKAKLAYSQSILNGLVLRDFDSIKSAAGAMKQITLHDPRQIEGDQIDNELYEHFRLEFLRLSTQLEQMADKENLEGTAYAYQNLTANCLACHSYLNADNRISLR